MAERKRWNRMRRILAGGLLIVQLSGLLVTGVFASGFQRGKSYTQGQFSDVPAGVWYEGAVKDCFELGLMSGSSATTFYPTGMFTVAEAATIAARMHHIYHGGDGVIPAIDGAWYQGAVDYCINNGIFASGDFDSLTRAATRAEMAGMMAAALPEAAWTAKNHVSALPDVSEGTPYSQAIFQLYDAGVFTGSDEYGMFQPYAYITRAEVAAIVARCADPAQRKALNLTPLSQREAVTLPGDSFKIMRNGRLGYRDTKSGMWGFLDASGAIVIPAAYQEIDYFSGGYARVKKDGKWGLVDTNGTVCLPFIYTAIYEQYNGVYIGNIDGVQKGDSYKNWCLIVNGRQVTSDDYDGFTKLSDDRFLAGYKGNQYKYGVIDSSGGTVIPFEYYSYGEKRTMQSSDGATLYQLKNMNPTSAWDTSGTLVSADQFFNFAEYNPYLYQVTPSQVIGALENGAYMIACKGDSGCDVFDRDGKLVNHYGESSWNIGGQLIRVKEGNKYALATAKGMLTEAIYDEITLFPHSDLAVVKYGEAEGLAGPNGEIAAPGTYQNWKVNKNYASAVGADSMYTYFTVSGQVSEKEAKSQNAVSAGQPSGVAASYVITKNSVGKPIVTYDGETVIDFYKNGLYYDEIKSLGEDYFACRYNTTWYLVHA